MQTAGLMNLLRAKFAPPAWAMLREVGDATGGRHSRWADAVAMGIWPSRGLELHGFELKVSRSDWTKELANPAKAEAVCRFCDRWWIVAGDESIVKPGELPATWGLMVPKANGLRTVTDAPKLEPVPISRNFLAALMRRVHEQGIDAAELAKARQEIRDKAWNEGKEHAERLHRNAEAREESRTNALQRELDQLKEKVRTFEEASGVSLGVGWQWENGRKIGDAVRQILNYGDPIERAMQSIKQIHSVLGELIRHHDTPAADKVV